MRLAVLYTVLCLLYSLCCTFYRHFRCFAVLYTVLATFPLFHVFFYAAQAQITLAMKTDCLEASVYPLFLVLINFNVAQASVTRVSQLFTRDRRIFLAFLSCLRGTGAYSSRFSAVYMAQAHYLSCLSAFNVAQSRIPRISQLLTWLRRVFLIFLNF
jgi:hypothetical protein